jgi:hypothetical protein
MSAKIAEQCADPVRGHYNDRFELRILEGVSLVEIMEKLRLPQ